MVFSPRHGVLIRRVRQSRLARVVVREDLLATLYRASESGEASTPVESLVRRRPLHGVHAALRRSERRGEVEVAGGKARLTEQGRHAAASLIRRHRLWEHYLVDEAGLLPDHVHETAEILEHLQTEPPEGPGVDPHGKRIPSGD